MVVPYLSYFKLKEEPFNTTANPRFFFLSPIHSIALGKTEFTVDAKKGLAIVFGDTGTGKSTLARLLHQKFREKEYTSVLLTNPNYPTTNSLLRTIIQEFQLPKTAKSYKDNLDIFKMFLYTEAVEKHKNIVLIIDEAQTLRLPLLELLRQLINFETNDQKLLQLVLFPQEEFRNKLTHPMARNFRSRVSMASTLDKMGLPEISEMIVSEMIDFRWRVASGNQDHPFTPEALDSIYLHSEGIPREACIIADNSLLLAFLQKKAVIEKDLVEIAAKDRKDNIGSAGKPDGKPQKKVEGQEAQAAERAVPAEQEVATNG
jgi:general secretion pathway protein A